MDLVNLTLSNEELRDLKIGIVKYIEFEDGDNIPEIAFLNDDNGLVKALGIRKKGLQEIEYGVILAPYEIMDVY